MPILKDLTPQELHTLRQETRVEIKKITRRLTRQEQLLQEIEKHLTRNTRVSLTVEQIEERLGYKITLVTPS